jgi:hypothetical protein
MSCSLQWLYCSAKTESTSSLVGWQWFPFNHCVSSCHRVIHPYTPSRNLLKVSSCALVQWTIGQLPSKSSCVAFMYSLKARDVWTTFLRCDSFTTGISFPFASYKARSTAVWNATKSWLATEFRKSRKKTCHFESRVHSTGVL